MSAQCDACASTAYEPDELLLREVLEDAAELRAEGRAWEEVAAAVEWDVCDLKRACRRDRRFAQQLEAARRELVRQAEAELVRVTREQLASANEAVRSDAADRLAKYLTAQRNCETRLKVERIRKKARLEAERIRAAGVNQKGRGRPRAEAGPEPDPEPEQTEREREHYWDCQRRQAVWAAEQQARGEAAVFLWGGCHRLGGAPPDGTDTPLQLTGDGTIGPLPDGRRVFWAVPVPCPVADPMNGPFLEPPGCRPAACPTDPVADGAEPGATAVAAPSSMA